MTRTWISRKDTRWVMQCDREECTTQSEPFESQPDLAIFAERGWFVDKLFGDRCPACVALGLLSPTAQPSRVMDRARLATEHRADLARQNEHYTAQPMIDDTGRDE